MRVTYKNEGKVTEGGMYKNIGCKVVSGTSQTFVLEKCGSEEFIR